jgi:hypothetical protein
VEIKKNVIRLIQFIQLHFGSRGSNELNSHLTILSDVFTLRSEELSRADPHTLCNSSRNSIMKGTGALRDESTDPRRQLRPLPDALLPFHFVTSLKGSIRPQLCFSVSRTEADSHSRERKCLRKARAESV